MPMPMRAVRTRHGSLPALALAAGTTALLVAFWHSIGFSSFTSDPLGYWANSLFWREPFNQFHVAGYPLLIALVRGSTFDAFTPTTVMTSITVVALLAGVHGTYRLAGLVGLSQRCSVASASVFAVWPFVGTVYTAFPVADTLVLALMVWGAFLLLRRRAATAGLLLGLAAVTHKSLWPAIALLAIASFFWNGLDRRFGATVAAFTATPLAALWIAGIASGQPVTWLVVGSTNDGIQPLTHHSLAIFDGLVGSLIYGDWIARARVLVVVPIVALAFVILLTHYRRWREPFSCIVTIFALEVVGLALVMSQHLVWSSARFSGLLAVPAVSLVATRIDATARRRWHVLAAIVVLVLIGTQLLTAWEGASRDWQGVL